MREQVNIQRRKVSDEVRDLLVTMLQTGELKPGDRLPAERDMAQRFGVSRTTLRDAIRELERLGHFEVRQGDGITVRQPDADALALPFRSLLEIRPQLSSDLLEFRRLLEPYMARLAARRRSKAQLRKLKASLARQADLIAAGQRLSDEDVRFHNLVAECANNATILSVLETLQSLLLDLRKKVLIGDKPQLALAHHSRIVQAIEQHKEEEAHEAMLEHLLSVEESLKPEVSNHSF